MICQHAIPNLQILPHDFQGEDNMTCLHYAAKAGHLEVIQYILDVSAVDINATVSSGLLSLCI